MNSKRIISAILATVMTFSLFGCGKKDEKKITADISQPSFENGTAVVEYPSTDSDGNEIIATTVINTPEEYKDNSASTTTKSAGSQNSGEVTPSTTKYTPAIKVMFTNPLNNLLATDEAKQDFINTQSNDYNISTEDAKKIVSNADHWTGFYCNFYIVNTNKQRISAKSVRVEPTADLIVSKSLGCEYNFKPGIGRTLNISGYVNTDKIGDDNSLLNALNAMNIQLEYALTDETSIDDWSSVTTKTMKIKF